LVLFGTYIPIEQWRAKARTGELPADAFTRLFRGPELRDLETTDKGITRIKSVGDRRYRFCMSRSTADRMGDVINQQGWQLENFKANPVAPWSHSYRELPMGTWPVVSASADELVGEMEFVKGGVNPDVDMVEQYVSLGIIRAVSVGFRVLDWSYDEERGGYNLNKNELLECSLCVVPMHPEALSRAKSMNVDLTFLRTYAEQILDGLEPGGIWMPKDVAAAAFRIQNAAKSVPVLAIEPPTPAEPIADLKTFNPLDLVTRDLLKSTISAGVAETVNARINRAVGRLD
jgi:HK97 family phage prohead protease